MIHAYLNTLAKTEIFPQVRLSVEWEARLSMLLGVLFLVGAVTGISWMGLPIIAGEVRQGVVESKKTEEVKQYQKMSFADYMAQDPLVKHLVPESADFNIIIPKIEINTRVIENVDANSKPEYMAALKEGLAHARGSETPGNKGDIFVFGHSTDVVWRIEEWNALFYNLKEMEVGDKIYVHYRGEPRVYRVTDKNIYSPTDLSFLDMSGENERLILQTCWPPGTALKRLIVVAEPVELPLVSYRLDK